LGAAAGEGVGLVVQSALFLSALESPMF